MAKLCLVEGDDHGQETDTDASETSSGVEVVDVLCCSLESSSNTKDQGTEEDGLLAAESISSEAGKECPKEGTTSEDGDYSANLIGVVAKP